MRATGATDLLHTTEYRMPAMAGVLYDTRWFGNHGIGRFAQEVFQNIPGSYVIRGRTPARASF